MRVTLPQKTIAGALNN